MIDFKMANVHTKTYSSDNKFLVDVVETENDYEAWIYRKGDGIKNLMFGCPKTQQSYSEFIELVMYNLDTYKHDYWLDAFDRDYAY